MVALIKFVIGGLLVIGSLVFGAGLIFSLPIAAMQNLEGGIFIWVIIDIVVFLIGLFLLKSH
jgi:hypothetical protein